MIRLDDLFQLFDSAFDYVLCLDGQGRILHANPQLCQACKLEPGSLDGRNIDSLVSPAALESFRLAMMAARTHRDRRFFLSVDAERPIQVPLKAAWLPMQDGEIFLFYEKQIGLVSAFSDWEKEERIKELACLYSVVEWIEVSASIREFFTHLPAYLLPGMQYPDQALVWSVYQGQEYGPRVPNGNSIRTEIRVRGQIRGEIRVGYLDDELALLADEQKMRNEIGRILNLALDRKELSENLASKEAEEAEMAKRVAQLETEIAGRTRELERQRKTLDTLNSSMDRINRDWLAAQKRLMTVFQAIPDPVAIIARQHNVIMTNRSDVSMGAKCHKTFFNRDVPCQDCRLVRVIRGKAPIRIETKLDDDFYEVHAIPIFNQDHEVEWITEFYRNITREKTYEMQLQQADKLASIGQLVSGIGHEINNPNQFIRGNIKILQEALQDMMPIVDAHYQAHPDLKIARLKYDFFRQHIQTLVNDMAHGSKRIKDIIDGLKQFARRDEGELVDNVEINTTVAAAARLVHNEVDKYAGIDLQLCPTLPTFLGNTQKMEQVLINLLLNAAQAMPDDRRGNIWVSTRQEDNSILITGKDDAKGMSEKTLKQIFDPFFTTRRARGGTGLGLPIVYRIVEEHGGTITVTSKLGGGSTFVIRLPIRTKTPSGLHAEPKKPAEGNSAVQEASK